MVRISLLIDSILQEGNIHQHWNWYTEGIWN